MRSASVLIACVVMVGATIVTVQAQMLQEGTCEGTTVLPSGSSVQTDFDVTVENGELAITYHSVQGPLPLTDISLEGDTLSYTFSAGVLVRCVVERQDDGSYTGECKTGNGETGRHTMKPPAS